MEDGINKDSFDKMMNSLDNLDKVLDNKKNEIREYLASLSYDDMKQEMRNFDKETLEKFCLTYGALENENYEICQAAQEILLELKNKQ